MAATGFSFGVKPTTTSATGGFSFGATATSQPATGLTFGTPGTATSSAAPTGFGIGTPASSTAAAGTGFTLGGSFTPAKTSAGMTGFGFATPASSTATGGLKLGGATGGGLLPTPSAGGVASTTTSSGGLNFATPAVATTSTAAVGASLFGQRTTASSLFGQPTASTAGSSLFGQTTSTSTGNSLFGQTTSSAAGTGLFGQPTAATSGGSLFGQTATSTAGTSLFGQPASTGTGTSIFGQPASKPASVGLGGVGPKTTTTTAGVSTDGSKTSEGKTVKENQVQNEILLDVDAFQKFVKDEKSETEHLKRMSSTPMVKVQEDSAALRQLLSVVSSGLQRNACAVEKLKHEMTQELKNAEMAMRTKEIPPGLQYENTAPTQYFQQLVENFETQMLTYRQQIEMLENHLSSLNQPNRLTADELVLLLRKLHEAFIAMAAQLQQVHEAVKTQKEHYLNYRKVFLGDSRNIFERQKKAPAKVITISREPYGHSPFNHATVAAMASALSRSHQPAGQGGAPPVTGFSNFPQPGGFGTANTAGTGGFGTLGTQGTGGFGTASTGSLFGNTSNLGTTQPSLFGSTTQPTQPQLNLSTSTEQPFQLAKPPVGSKRGKR